MSELTAPWPASAWRDADGRVLAVAEVRPGDVLGREVVGRIGNRDGDRDYACDLLTWAAVWRDGIPATVRR